MMFFETHHQRKSDGSEGRTRKWGSGFTLVFASWLGLDIATPAGLLRIFVGLASSICPLPEFSPPADLRDIA